VTPENWALLERLCEDGLKIEKPERARWVASLVVDDEVRRALASMLQMDTGDNATFRRNFDALFVEALEAPQPGLRLGPWRLLNELGQGGMGYVFLAERADDQFRQQVAIKLIRGHADQTAVRLLRQERQILAELVHPNIARLLDGGETAQGQPYLVMEYVAGRPLVDAMDEGSLGDLDERVRIVHALAGAVHYAHQRLVIHRDIKPGNVMLRDNGQPVLLDFGIARLLDEDTGTSRATQPWFTPAYASPEQRKGLPLGTLTDVYALGLLLCELATGRVPETNALDELVLPAATAKGWLQGSRERELHRIILRAAAADPQRRYDSAKALADDLARWLDGKPVQAVSDSIAYRAAKLLRRRPYTSVLLASLSLLLGFFAWRQTHDHQRALAAELAAQRQTEAAEAATSYLVDLFREVEPKGLHGTPATPSSLVDRGVEQLARSGDMPLLQRVRLLAAFGEIYVNLGQPEKASSVLRDSALLRSDLPPTVLAQVHEQLARAADFRNRYGEAERNYRAAAGLWRASARPRELARTLSSLGLLQSRTDRLREAEASSREAISLQENADGAQAIDTLRYRVSLAEILSRGARKDEARRMMEESLAGLRARLAPDHPVLLSALGFYGVLLRDNGDSEGAERIFLEILRHRQSMLGVDSHKVALTHNNLGGVYYNRGDTWKAIEQFRAAHEANARAGSERDPARALGMMNLAALYEEVGDFESAEPLMRDGAQILAGHDDAGVLEASSTQNLGRLLLLAGKSAEARIWLEKPIPDHGGPDYALERGRQRIHLAEWHRRFGDPQQAWFWLEKAEDNLADVGGPDSPRVAAIKRLRGLLLDAKGDYAGARRELEAARERLVAARRPRYVGVGDLSLDLAEVALHAGDDATARRELQHAHRILEPQLAPQAPQRERLAAAAKRLGLRLGQ
jgi:serine/threonine protein kinase